ncbi:endonuclease/exonuclease/phosphatase family protein [Marivirga sp.]|uniref:endonuclease/exonuclease/phosphatase family protein n=1 Tax=Marivirga sp. TaxID=2018662 RepID=UPI002D80A696|nr:endonuclease/exonuclease/phosphatase family protein [Marivirga sp.]HET8861592.1 endonuclease/exonuclease/phosphatase family protein [Marivirga sp.]
MIGVLQIVIYSFGGILIFISLLPLIRHDHWTFRIFEFPRVQKWVLNIMILVASILIFPDDAYFSFGFILLLVANLLYLSYQIYPYLPIAQKQMESVAQNKRPNIKLLIANVYQENRKWGKLIDMVQGEQADVVLLVETDEWWKNKCCDTFGNDYKYQVLENRENTYGMLLFSKLELKNTQIHYWVKDEIPSIETDIQIDNRFIKLYAIHPEPPVPSQNPKSTARDAEILLVGQKTKADQVPTIVAGDLNDVAWSYTSELFLKISGLLDPRRGRGLFSSFHAKHWYARWPLDHVFCSGHFRLQKIRRMGDIGSDHFPILLQLFLAKTDDDSEELENSEEDESLSKEKINKA